MNCPACSNYNIFTRSVGEKFSDKYGNEVNFYITENVCLSCESFGDFEKVNDPLYLEKVRELDLLTIVSIFKIITNNFSDYSVERQLRLSKGVISKWRGDPSSISEEGVSLLKIIGKDLCVLYRGVR